MSVPSTDAKSSGVPVTQISHAGTGQSWQALGAAQRGASYRRRLIEFVAARNSPRDHDSMGRPLRYTPGEVDGFECARHDLDYADEALAPIQVTSSRFHALHSS